MHRSCPAAATSAGGSSVEKGESLKDTVLTLAAHSPDAIVIRAPWAGTPEIVTEYTDASIVNAGDGKREHPTQALLDLFTMRQKLGDDLSGRSVWIVGDVSHSRVARSLIRALRLVDVDVTVCGPPTLIPPEIEALGCTVRYDLDGVRDADVVYTLRLQHERMTAAGLLPSLGEYASCYQINSARLSPNQVVMHPGPVNRGVELSGEMVDSPQAVITMQVKAGVVVRMAVLYELLAGSRTGVAA